MLAKIDVPIKSGKLESISVDTIRSALSRCGFDQEGLADKGEEISEEFDGQRFCVLGRSEEHFRLLIRKNLDDASTEAKAELSKRGFYCGAHTPTESNIFASKIDGGNFRIYCQQRDAKKLQRSIDHMIDQLTSKKFAAIVDRRGFRRSDSAIAISSGAIGTEILQGRAAHSIRSFLKEREAEWHLLIGLAVATVLAFLVAGGNVTAAPGDSRAMAWAKVVLPSISLATMTIVLSLVLGFRASRKGAVDWRWKGLD